MMLAADLFDPAVKPLKKLFARRAVGAGLIVNAMMMVADEGSRSLLRLLAFRVHNQPLPSTTTLGINVAKSNMREKKLCCN